MQDPVVPPSERGGQGIDDRGLVSAHAKPVAILLRQGLVQAPAMLERSDLSCRDLGVLCEAIGRVSLGSHHEEQQDGDQDEHRDSQDAAPDRVFDHSARSSIGGGDEHGVPVAPFVGFPMEPDPLAQLTVQFPTSHSAPTCVGLPVKLWILGATSHTSLR